MSQMSIEGQIDREIIAAAEVSPRPQRRRFEDEAVEVLSEVKTQLTRVLTATGVSNAAGLQRTLKLDPTLSYLLFRISAEPRVLAVGSWVPSRVSIAKFVKGAAKLNVSTRMLNALEASYCKFEGLVERHAGDRTSFNSLITAVAGKTDEWLSVDLQHRRNAFRAMSHITGVQAKARVVANVLGLADGKRFNSAYAVGYAGLRVLREQKKIRLHGLHFHNDNPTDTAEAPRRLPLDLSAEGQGYLIGRYSTSPVPKLVIDEGANGKDSWVQTSLVEPELGNMGVSTLLFGEKICYDPRWNDQANYNHTNFLPTERLIQDVIVQPGVLKARPSLRVHLGSDQVKNRAPDAQELEGNYAVKFVGKGTSSIEIEELPGYANLVRDLGEELGYDVENFDVWRFEFDFPIYQSSSCIYWKTDPALR